MGKKIIGLLMLIVFIFFGCGGGGGGGSSDVTSSDEDKPTVKVCEGLCGPENVTVRPIMSRKAVTSIPFNTINEISWDPVAGAVAYNIYWNTSGGVTTSDNKISEAFSPFIHTNLTNGVTYYYMVTAVARDGIEGSPSEEVSSAPLASPENVTATPGYDENTITWDNVTGATSYNIYWLNTPGVSSGSINVIEDVTSPYRHINLTNNSNYYYVVTALNGVGQSDESTPTVSAMPIVELPPPPGNVNITEGIDRIDINWNAVPGATSYNVYWLTDPGVTIGEGNKIPVTSGTSYTHDVLADGSTRYYYVVSTVDDAGEGDASVEVSAEPIVQIPAQPVNVTATTGNSRIEITWDAVSSPIAVSYNIYWLDRSGVTTGNGTRITGVTSPYIHSGRTNFQEYYYIVTAVNTTGESSASAQVSARAEAPPENVRATAGETSNSITWNSVVNANSYNVYWLTTSSVTPGTGNKITLGNTTSWTHAGLTSGTRYYYVVTAVNGEEGPASGQVSAMPVIPVPPAPANVSATSGINSNVITWTKEGGITYNIYWRDSSGVTTGNGTRITNVTTPYTHSGLQNGTRYYYIVTAQNTTGEGPASNQVSASTVVAPPGNVSAAVGENSNRITWNNVSGADVYNIYWLTTSGVTQGNGNKITNVTSGYTHSDLTNYQAYYYIITAENSDGESLDSAQVSATPVDPTPSRPENVTAATAGNTSNVITWTQVAGITSYNIYWRDRSGVTTGNGTRITNVTSPYTHSGLNNGTTYYYIVSAINRSGEGPASSPEVSVTTPVASPGSVSAFADDTTTRITWSAVANASSYNIYWLNADGVTKGTGNKITGVSSGYTHSGLTNSLRYYYIVTAVGTGGESLASAQVSATPGEPTPSAPQNVTAATSGYTSNVITWATAAGVTSYNIYWRTSPGVTTGNGERIAGATSPYIHSDRNNGTTYYYIVTAVNDAGEGPASNEVSATTPVASPEGVSVSAGDTSNQITWNSVSGASSYNIYWLNTNGVTKGNGNKITLTGTTPISLSKAGYDVNERIDVNYVNLPGNSRDWIGIFVRGSAHTEYLQFFYSGGAQSGTMSFDGLDSGEYDARLFFDDSYNMEAEVSFTVSNGGSGTLTSTSYTHSGLTNGLEYYYIVTAVGTGGESLASSQVSATPGDPTPAAPQNVAAVTAGNNSNVITWNPVAGVTSYTIYWRDSSGVTTGNGTRITNATSPYTHSGRNNGSTYYYIVTAINDAGESPASSPEASATIPVAPPGNVSASAGDTSNQLTWWDVDNATSYNIYWLNANGVTKGTGNKITNVSSGYTHSGLTNGLEYYYIVTAVGTGGESLASSQVSATPGESTTSTPQNVAATTAGNTSNVITWTSAAGVSSYNIYWRTSSGVTTGNGDRISGATSPYIHSGRNNGTTYYYIVTAINGAGEGSASNEVSVTTPVESPRDVSASFGDTSNEITWRDVDNATSYNIYWLNTDGVTKGNGNKLTNVTSGYTHSGLTNGLRYYYIVTAVGTGGESLASSERSATPEDPSPSTLPAPTSVSLSSGNTSIVITWNAVAGATSYKIFRAGSEIADVPTGPYRDSGLTNGTPYGSYNVSAVNSAGDQGPVSSGVHMATPIESSAPAGVIAKAGNTNNVLSWDSVSGATSYNIYWKTSSGVTTDDNRIENVGSPFTHSGLTNLLTHYYIITAVDANAVDADGNPAPTEIASSEVSATPRNQPPLNVRAETTGGTSNVITWDSVAGATSYNIYWRDSSGVTTDNGDRISDLTSPYIHSGLDNDTTYYYIVTARVGDDENTSSEVSATTPVYPPTNVSASAGDRSNEITWEGVDHAVSYNLYWSNSSGVTTDNGTKISLGNTTSYTHSGLINYLDYYYIVTAEGFSGQSLASSQASATPGDPAPSAPQNVTAATAGNSSNVITWTEVAGVTYTIYWRDRSGVTIDNGSDITGVTSPYTHSGLNSGTTYYYIVTAENGSGEGNASSQVSATTPVGRPTGVSVSADDASNRITWSNVSGATSYNIYWSNSSGVTTDNGTKITGVSSGYTHSGLINGSEYFYIVTAVNSGGQSPASDQASGTPGEPVPSAPQNVTAATAGNTSTVITWTEVAGVTYNIYWRDRSGVTTGNGARITNVTTPYTHSGLSNGTTYYYIVTAVNRVGEGSPSSQVSATTPVGRPRNVAASANDGSNRITWSDVSGASSYTIYWSNSTGVSTDNGTQITGVSSGYTHSGLINGAEYFYIVTAVNSGGQSPASTQVSATPGAIPLAPQGVTAVTAGNTSIDIAWAKVPGVTYTIYWRNTSGVVIGNNPITNVTSPYTHSGRNNGTTYYYIVTATNGAGQGPASPQVSATTPVTSPTNVSASARDRSNRITWSNVTGAASYNIYWSNSTGVTTDNGTKITNVSSGYTHSGLINGSEYFYIVTAVNGGGQSPASNPASATPGNLPSPPSGVTVTPANMINVISWNTVADTSYNIYWRDRSGVTTSNDRIENVTPPYTHSGRNNGTTYYYIVTAVNSSGEGSASSQVSATPEVPNPSTPSNVTVTAGGAQNTITWANIDGATSYNIYWRTSSGVTQDNGSRITLGNTTSHTHTGLTNGTTYYYVVTAVNRAGESDDSTQVSAMPVAYPIVNVTAGNTINVISWNTISGASWYNLYWSTSPGVTTGNGTKISPVISPYTHTGLTNGETYYYIITAENGTGEGIASSVVSSEPVVPVSSAPSNVQATPGAALNTITWAAVDGATSYNIYWRDRSGVTQGNGDRITLGDTTTYTHSGLSNGNTYYYIVTAINDGGESVDSTQVSASPTAIPARPELTVTPGNTVNEITWNTVVGATSYNIYWNTSGGVTTGDTKITSATSPYKHTDLTNKTTYYYIVTAVNTSGESTPSAIVASTPVIPIPGEPTYVTATQGNTLNNIVWDSVPGALSYNIYWRNTSPVTTNNGTRITDSITTNSYQHTGLENYRPYYYIVTAVNDTGESAASSEVTATPELPIPDLPESVTATPGNEYNTIIWDESEYALWYNIYWDYTPGVTPETGNKLPSVTTPYKHIDLEPKVMIYYVITAENRTGESRPSREVSAEPLFLDPVTDTSQTKCYDNLNEITCPDEGEAFYGQDACYTIDPPVYTKIDSDGHVLPNSASNWVMVRDTMTGRTWEVKSTDRGVQNLYNTYTWSEAESYPDSLNLGPFTDWRLPTVKELRMIVDNSVIEPSIHDGYFPNTVPSFYWTSTELAEWTRLNAWYVHFIYGHTSNITKDDSYSVRAVRGGPDWSTTTTPKFTENFAVNGDVTIRDNHTGLIWTKPTASELMDWEDALSYCEGLTFAGESDWRLPTVKELQSIKDYENYYNSFDESFIYDMDPFTDTEPVFYWSSTTYSDAHPDHAWAVSFNQGYVEAKLKTHYLPGAVGYVRAVRGGEIVE